MNGRAAKLLRKIAEKTGTSYENLKRAWKKKNHIEKGLIRRNLAQFLR